VANWLQYEWFRAYVFIVFCLFHYWAFLKLIDFIDYCYHAKKDSPDGR
jgi:hypothetical protein